MPPADVEKSRRWNSMKFVMLTGENNKQNDVTVCTACQKWLLALLLNNPTFYVCTAAGFNCYLSAYLSIYLSFSLSLSLSLSLILLFIYTYTNVHRGSIKYRNECFKPCFYRSVIMDRGQLWLMRWILVWAMPRVQDRSLDLLTCSPTRYHCPCYGYPL